MPLAKGTRYPRHGITAGVSPPELRSMESMGENWSNSLQRRRRHNLLGSGQNNPGERPMKLGGVLAITVFAAALTAFAAPTCPAPQVAQGSNCTLSVTLGWAAAGLGTQSILQFYVSPTASGPVTWTLTAINSSLGSTYTGFMGITVQGFSPGPGIPITVASATPDVLNPGGYDVIRVAQVCWDSTCTAPAPSGPVANMFSAQLLISAPNPADVTAAVTTLTIQFLNGNQVTFEEAETPNSPGRMFPTFLASALAALPHQDTSTTALR